MATGYAPPLNDIRFVLDHVVDLAGLSRLPDLEHADPATVHGLLEEYGRFTAEVFAPLDRPGDQQGSRFDPSTGSVTTPDGWPDAYRRYVEGGWGSVPFEPEHGGGGFPWLVAVAMQELLTSASMSFSLCPLLTQGAIDMLTAWGGEEHEVYLQRMISGEWAGTMNLTEPEAGSDVGALRTKALPADDGTWRIKGQKIFITYGEHDLTDNIVHLVLARTPDAGPGTKGISCFIVPKFVVAADGSPGERNDVRCVSIEHKLGIHASPTCVMAYGDDGDGAVGYLIGEANAGMRYMFTMMNNARLSVGLQGLAVAERAYQAALAQAQERRQGRRPGQRANETVAIIEHPDVRRMLLTQRSSIEAMRALMYLNAWAIDVARHHSDALERERHQELVDLLTPVSKAWSTDLGNELTSLALQVHGGMGYVEETGVAQYYRDIRIAAIYEGTNGIQAIDLVTRKLPMRDGAAVGELIERMRSEKLPVAPSDAGSSGDGDELASLRAGLADAVDALDEATAYLLGRGAGAGSGSGSGSPEDALAGATPYLRMFGTVAGGWLLARQAGAATRLLGTAGGGGGYDADFLRAKVATARFYAEQLLPEARGLLGAVTAGADDLFAIEPKHLTGV
ncbi:MAG: acyl-CoA dehydrogenase [Acidimicrobiales bacterium]